LRQVNTGGLNGVVPSTPGFISESLMALQAWTVSIPNGCCGAREAEETDLQPTNLSDPAYFHKVVDCQWACPAHTPCLNTFSDRSGGHRARWRQHSNEGVSVGACCCPPPMTGSASQSPKRARLATMAGRCSIEMAPIAAELAAY
jgi:hypothetical protein